MQERAAAVVMMKVDRRATQYLHSSLSHSEGRTDWHQPCREDRVLTRLCELERDGGRLAFSICAIMLS